MGGIDNQSSNLASTTAAVQGVFLTDRVGRFVYCGIPYKNRFSHPFEAFNREVLMGRPDDGLVDVRKDALMPAIFVKEHS